MMVRSLLVNYFRFYSKCLDTHLCLGTGIPTYYFRQETQQSKEQLWHTFLVPFVFKISDTCLGNDQTKEHQQYVHICCAMLLYYSVWRWSYGWSGFIWCTHCTCIGHVLNESLVFIIHLTWKFKFVFAQNLIAFPCDIQWKCRYVPAFCSKPQENIRSTQCLDILAHLRETSVPCRKTVHANIWQRHILGPVLYLQRYVSAILTQVIPIYAVDQ